MVPAKSTKKVSRTPVVETSIEKPEVVLRTDAETIKIYSELLDTAPPMPSFNSMGEVTVWIDKTYRHWISKVNQELGK